MRGDDRCGLHACWCAALAIGIACVPSSALAQAYPSKPITMIVPVGPGGPIDMVARLVAPPMAKVLGQAVTVENRPGASQKIAILSLLRAPRDGYAVLVTSPAGLTINPLLDRAIGYDPLKDFTFITKAVSLYYVLVSNPSLPVKSVQELVAYAKANPDKLAYGSGGNGSHTHFSTQQLLDRLGISALPVHYKGEGPALMDVFSGQVQFMVAASGAAKPFIDSGKLNALASTGLERLPDLPNVPSHRQTGIKALENFTIQSWVGFAAAAGIPAEATKKLHDALAKALQLPEVRKSLEVAGFQVAGSTPAEFAGMVRATIEENRKLIESGAVKLE